MKRIKSIKCLSCGATSDLFINLETEDGYISVGVDNKVYSNDASRTELDINLDTIEVGDYSYIDCIIGCEDECSGEVTFEDGTVLEDEEAIDYLLSF